MENPSYWKRAEKVIADAHREWKKASRGDVCGLSLPATIATRLREAGIVNDADEPALGWEGLGESPEATRRPR